MATNKYPSAIEEGDDVTVGGIFGNLRGLEAQLQKMLNWHLKEAVISMSKIILQPQLLYFLAPSKEILAENSNSKPTLTSVFDD